MNLVARMLRILLHQSLIAQGITAISALVCVAVLARGLETNEYAHYAVVTAVWAIGNAVVGTGTGTRIARTAAEGAGQIRFQRSELWISFIAAIVTAAYVGLVRVSPIEGALAGLCMISFIAAEAGTAYEIGSGNFNRYLTILGLRALLPPILLSIATATGTLTFATAVSCVLTGNIASLLIWPKRWSLHLEGSSESTAHSVGAINMGLWIIASADRLILERIVTAVDLASYALAYGLADRVFRSLSNAYIAKTLGRAFQGHVRSPGWQFYLGTLLVGALLVPGIQAATVLLSANRYTTTMELALSIAVAGLFMIWSAPQYVKLMAYGRYRSSLICVFVLAIVNIIGNLLFAGVLGILGAAFISVCTYALWFVWLTLGTRSPNQSLLDGNRHVRTKDALIPRRA